MALLDEIAAQLQVLGCGTVGTTIFTGYLPPAPDVCCVIYETGGQAPEFRLGSAAIYYETPGIQVVFRGEPDDYAAARALAETAYRGLAQVEATTLSGTFYHGIAPTQAPVMYMRDGLRRPLISVNFLCEKELSA